MDTHASNGRAREVRLGSQKPILKNTVKKKKIEWSHVVDGIVLHNIPGLKKKKKKKKDIDLTGSEEIVRTNCREDARGWNEQKTTAEIGLRVIKSNWSPPFYERSLWGLRD